MYGLFHKTLPKCQHTKNRCRALPPSTQQGTLLRRRLRGCGTLPLQVLKFQSSFLSESLAVSSSHLFACFSFKYKTLDLIQNMETNKVSTIQVNFTLFHLALTIWRNAWLNPMRLTINEKGNVNG
jgi:hypothetical protein